MRAGQLFAIDQLNAVVLDGNDVRFTQWTKNWDSIKHSEMINWDKARGGNHVQRAESGPVLLPLV